MPTYAFACPKCGAQAEDIRQMKDFDSPTFCAGDAILAPDLQKEMTIDGEPHEPVRMEHGVAMFTGIVRGGTRYAR